MIEMPCQPNPSENPAFMYAFDITFRIVIMVAAIRYIAFG